MGRSFPEQKCAEVAQRLLRRYSRQTKAWTLELNSEWICRTYFAAKLVLAATVHLNSLEFAERKNLRVVVPYLRYYSLLSTLRAVHLLLPETPWNRGEVISASHSVVIREVLQFVATLDIAVAASMQTQIRKLKAARELVSYRAPSSGDDAIAADASLIDTCTLLCELSQYASELLQASVKKNADPSTFGLKPEFAQSIAFVELEGEMFADREDAWRLAKLSHSKSHPYSIWLMMSEGHVDDFFGAWSPLEEADGLFDPDRDHQVIFDIP